jgi:hypothetical protein
MKIALSNLQTLSYYGQKVAVDQGNLRDQPAFGPISCEKEIAGVWNDFFPRLLAKPFRLIVQVQPVINIPYAVESRSLLGETV